MVKRYKSLVVAMCLLGLLFLTVKPAFAAIIDVVYYWYSTGGTKAVGDETWTFGNIGGMKLFKVEERYDSVANEFQYTLSNQRSDKATYAITKWELYHPYGVIASSITNGPTDWSVTTSSDKWVWSTPTYSNGADGAGDVDFFRVYTGYPRGLVTGKVYFFDSLGNAPASNPTASGLVSGPVPEPTSLLLLGGGLLGVALLGVARRRKITV